jgi:hypothetical protein
MKKNIIIFFLLLLPFPFFFSKVEAQVSSTSSADQATQKAIETLKNKIASQVSSMNLEEKRGIIGVVTSTSDNAFTVTDISGNNMDVDVDEITKFSDPNNSNFGFSDLTRGSKVSVLGLYNKETKRILARFIDAQDDPLFLSGAVLSLDHVNYQLMLIQEGGHKQNVDIQISTKISDYEKGQGLSHYGFSKMNVGDRITVVGYLNKTDKTLLEADRIVDFSDLPKDPNITMPASASASPTPVTSGTP